jgi:2-polyprenyl-3-methyl-5-hydroxy-6-metoxy-1,4-benzoquinol methylase
MGHTGAPDSADLLEIGCGAGFAADYLQSRYGSYHGIDHSTELVEIAGTFNVGPEITFETADAATFSSDRRFDVIFMIGVLHHLENPAGTLHHLTTFLKPSGSIVVNEPFDGNPLIRFARRIRKRTDPHYSKDQDFYSRHGLSTIFEKAGCEVVKLVPQGLFSTPFAEVVMPGQAVLSPLSSLACTVDRSLERLVPWALNGLAWNLIAIAVPTDRQRR